MPEELIVGIDPGTSKVGVLVATVESHGDLSVIAAADEPGGGMRHGVVVNVAELSSAVAFALDVAEQRSSQKITSAYVALAGRHLTARNTCGSVLITPGGREIAYHDVERAIAAARADVELDENREIVHQLPRGYSVDGQDGVPNPLGMAGYKLEVETHVITGSSTTIQNLIKCVKSAQVEVEDVVSAPVAAAGAVLTPAEREMGALVADLGAGTSGVALFIHGFPWLTGDLPGGGSTITEGIATSLRLPLEVAEQLKVRYGHADPQQIVEDELIELAEMDLIVPRTDLAQVIQDRVREVIAPLRNALGHAQSAGVRPMGVVLTGGTAQLPGLASAVERMLGLPTRVGAPRGLHGLPGYVGGPAFATAAGLLLWGAQQAAGSGHTGRGQRRRWHLGELPRHLPKWIHAFLP
jgi:cell division protein FtsA